MDTGDAVVIDQPLRSARRRFARGASAKDTKSRAFSPPPAAPRSATTTGSSVTFRLASVTFFYRIAGESHGKALITLIEGMPAGVPLDRPFSDNDLRRRQGGYGRGGSQKIETDAIECLTGVLM